MKLFLPYIILTLPFIQCMYPYYMYETTYPPELDTTAPEPPPPLPTINDPDYNFDVPISETDTDSEQDTDYPNINFNRMELPKSDHFILDRVSADPRSTEANFRRGEILPDTLDSILADLPRTRKALSSSDTESTEAGSSSRGISENKHHVLRKKMKKKK